MNIMVQILVSAKSAIDLSLQLILRASLRTPESLKIEAVPLIYRCIIYRCLYFLPPVRETEKAYRLLLLESPIPPILNSKKTLKKQDHNSKYTNFYNRTARIDGKYVTDEDEWRDKRLCITLRNRFDR